MSDQKPSFDPEKIVPVSGGEPIVPRTLRVDDNPLPHLPAGFEATIRWIVRDELANRSRRAL